MSVLPYSCDHSLERCSTHFTLKAAERNGMEIVHTDNARTWKYQGEPFYTNIKAPHGDVVFLCKDLHTQERDGTEKDPQLL